jgi:type II secretory pathway pseudopilin PulG
LNPGVTVCPSCGHGVAAPAKAGLSTTAVVLIVVAVGGLMAVVIIGVIAAVAIPSLLRARVAANESMAIGNLRTVLSAEAAYQAANGGYFDRPSCLYAPAECLGPSAPGTAFLEPASLVFDAPKSGYVLRFHPGAAAADPSAVSPSSLQSFAVTAVPASPQGGVRSFCTDARGDVCVMAATGRTPEDGYCPEGCAALR